MLRRALAAAAVFVNGATAFAQAAEPLAVETSGQIEVQDETRIAIEGVTGHVVLQLGQPKQVSFASRRIGGKTDDLPIALYSEGGVFRFVPPEGEPAGTPRVLLVSVPPELAASVRLDRSKLSVSGLRGGLEVRGASIEATLSGLESDSDLTLDQGSVNAASIAGRLRIRGTKLEVKAEKVVGSVDLTQNGGTAAVTGVDGPFEGDLDGATLKLVAVAGEIHLRARTSQLDVAEAAAGGDLQLLQSPLKLRGCKGDLTISTDADVQFADLKAALHFDSYGGSLRGQGNDGLLEIRTRSAEITLERIVGPVRIQGDGLRINLRDMSGGETLIYSRTSEINLESIFGTLTIENDGGNIQVTRATSDVTIKSSGGEVKLIDLNGAVQLDADANDVEISWASITGDKDSSIRNDKGKVSAHFPPQSSGRVEAKSSYGRIDANVPRIQLLEGGKEAQGPLGGGNRPIIRIAAGGDIELRAGNGN